MSCSLGFELLNAKIQNCSKSFYIFHLQQNALRTSFSFYVKTNTDSFYMFCSTKVSSSGNMNQPIVRGLLRRYCVLRFHSVSYNCLHLMTWCLYTMQNILAAFAILDYVLCNYSLIRLPRWRSLCGLKHVGIFCVVAQHKYLRNNLMHFLLDFWINVQISLSLLWPSFVALI